MGGCFYQNGADQKARAAAPQFGLHPANGGPWHLARIHPLARVFCPHAGQMSAIGWPLCMCRGKRQSQKEHARQWNALGNVFAVKPKSVGANEKLTREESFF
ncbi:hypothetical protein AA0312_2494 [Acetobacter tropicalis NRIC 0312]|uniref:Uncharacterized protein n=1 Tax=Acetobacter tropicalis TaxID=104102 RepID=A0A511FL53_9PROT|nr:hypothetical protein ATR1_067d0114 [Acetobacter tropicalis]GBR71755.1 hypothetical protein AA0312_2494 [Acetobacter tropicalis NRIC 0312]GEL49294.1 hypothetical protein ATR01nite_03690 [Acetobacter tropicalis]